MNPVDLFTAQQETAYWKRVAAHLASCHAASLEGLPKSAAKSERRRLASICRDAAAFLKGTKTLHGYHTNHDEQVSWEIRRCENAAAKYDVPDTKPDAKASDS